jgi:hypothetical protein
LLPIESLKKEIPVLIFQTLTVGVSLFLLWAYGSLLDFFPWGSNEAYVIWEPLVLYFIVPSFLIIGCIIMLISKSRNLVTIGLHLFLVGLAFTIPSLMGFDLESDLRGRWCGVIVSITVTVFAVKGIICSIYRIPSKTSGAED